MSPRFAAPKRIDRHTREIFQDPDTGLLYVNSNDIAWTGALAASDTAVDAMLTQAGVLVEDRLFGIKSREFYEAPAASLLHLAYQELAALVRETSALGPVQGDLRAGEGRPAAAHGPPQPAAGAHLHPHARRSAGHPDPARRPSRRSAERIRRRAGPRRTAAAHRLPAGAARTRGRVPPWRRGTKRSDEPGFRGPSRVPRDGSDPDALVPAIRKAWESKIPVVLIDSQIADSGKQYYQSFLATELDGAGYGTAGHLMCVVGFTEQGDVVANDPYIADDTAVRRVYDRGQFETVWLRTKRYNADGQVRGGGGANTSWDGSWNVATSQDAQGWYVEMRIPFSTLRYGPREEQVWGVNLARYIGRKNEQVFWSPVPRQFGFYRLTEAGLLRREPYKEPGSRTRHEYVLTDMGADLMPAVFALKDWGDTHLQEGGGPLALVEDDTGAPVRVGYLTEDGREVSPADLRMAVRRRRAEG